MHGEMEGSVAADVTPCLGQQQQRRQQWWLGHGDVSAAGLAVQHRSDSNMATVVLATRGRTVATAAALVELQELQERNNGSGVVV
jgi:hypothetical protein